MKEMMLAKCAAPDPVQPVIYKNVGYRVPDHTMGVVEAYDIASGTILWNKPVYTVTYTPELETDVQDVYITKLSITRGSFWVTNENNEHFRVDLQTGHVLGTFASIPKVSHLYYGLTAIGILLACALAFFLLT